MSIPCRYVHTNIIAKDWQGLAKFYQDIFGCTPVPPERHFKGEKLEAGTGIRNAELKGIHLRLPGHGDNGPTLEIFNYNLLEEGVKTAINRPGIGHIAFAVGNVSTAREAVLKAGGKALGEIVTLEVTKESKVTWCYATDPEGNILELQSWSK